MKYIYIGGLITLIRDIRFTTTDIPSTINIHNTKLQMVKVHIDNTKHTTIAIIYIPPHDNTSTHYKTADTDIQHCIHYITNIPHSVSVILYYKFYYIAWRKVMRKAWNLPFTTHCRFIHTINNYLPIDVQLEEKKMFEMFALLYKRL